MDAHAHPLLSWKAMRLNPSQSIFEFSCCRIVKLHFWLHFRLTRGKQIIHFLHSFLLVIHADMFINIGSDRIVAMS